MMHRLCELVAKVVARARWGIATFVDPVVEVVGTVRGSRTRGRTTGVVFAASGARGEGVDDRDVAENEARRERRGRLQGREAKKLFVVCYGIAASLTIEIAQTTSLLPQ